MGEGQIIGGIGVTRKEVSGADGHRRLGVLAANRRGQSTVITDDVCVVVLPLLENELRVISVSVGKCAAVGTTTDDGTADGCVADLPNPMPPDPLPNHRPKTCFGPPGLAPPTVAPDLTGPAATDDATVAFRTLS